MKYYVHNIAKCAKCPVARWAESALDDVLTHIIVLIVKQFIGSFVYVTKIAVFVGYSIYQVYYICFNFKGDEKITDSIQWQNCI